MPQVKHLRERRKETYQPHQTCDWLLGKEEITPKDFCHQLSRIIVPITFLYFVNFLDFVEICDQCAYWSSHQVCPVGTQDRPNRIQELMVS